MELNCFTVFPLGNYLNKNLSLSCSLDTKASYIFKTSFRRQKYAPVFFKRHVIFLNISVGSAVLWQHTSNNMKKSIPFVCRYYLCLQDYFGTFLFFFQSTPWISIFKIVKKKKVSNWIYSEMEKDISMHSCLICMWKFLSGHKVVFMQSWRRWLLNDHFLEANSIFIYFSYILIYLVLSVLSLNNINLKNNFYFLELLFLALNTWRFFFQSRVRLDKHRHKAANCSRSPRTSATKGLPLPCSKDAGWTPGSTFATEAKIPSSLRNTHILA